MKRLPSSTTAHIPLGMYCRDCGWPVVDACCNHEFQNFKDAAEWDWWYYCSNKGCKNHNGEGVCQDTPEWIGRDKITSCVECPNDGDCVNQLDDGPTVPCVD